MLSIILALSLFQTDPSIFPNGLKLNHQYLPLLTIVGVSECCSVFLTSILASSFAPIFLCIFIFWGALTYPHFPFQNFFFKARFSLSCQVTFVGHLSEPSLTSRHGVHTTPAGFPKPAALSCPLFEVCGSQVPPGSDCPFHCPMSSISGASRKDLVSSH